MALARLEELVSAGLHPAREAAKVERLPPYDLRHEFASLQIRAGMSVPELAEQMGHSSAMTLRTYTHVIRELKGEPIMAAADQIEAALQERRGRLGGVGNTEAPGA